MLIAIYWTVCFIYFKTMPVLLFDTTATLSFAAISATISSFCAAIFIVRSNIEHFKWAGIEEHRGPIPLKPIGFLIIFCAATVLCSYFISIGFSSSLYRDVFVRSYDDADPFLFALMISSPPIVLYGILLREAFKLCRIADGDIS